MEVVSFKLYQRKFIFDDLSSHVLQRSWRERVGLAVWGGVCVCGAGGGGGKRVGGDRQTETERDRESCIQNLFCFSTVLQVTAAEVKPIS